MKKSIKVDGSQELKDFILCCLKNAKGDDAYRAQMAFRGLTKKQMQEQHGQSGKTRQQILDGYLKYDAKVDNAIALVKHYIP